MVGKLNGKCVDNAFTMLGLITLIEHLMTLPKAFKRFKDAKKSRDQGIGQKSFNHLLFTPLIREGIPP